MKVRGRATGVHQLTLQSNNGWTAGSFAPLPARPCPFCPSTWAPQWHDICLHCSRHNYLTLFTASCQNGLIFLYRPASGRSSRTFNTVMNWSHQGILRVFWLFGKGRWLCRQTLMPFTWGGIVVCCDLRCLIYFGHQCVRSSIGYFALVTWSRITFVLQIFAQWLACLVGLLCIIVLYLVTIHLWLWL